MVSLFSGLIIAHGNDPRALPPAELFGNWALAIVALTLAGAAASLVLKPVLQQAEGKSRSEVAGWTAIGLAVLVAMATWITRQSLVEALSPPPPPEEHQHALYHGGQITMWGDYHCEVARSISGEYRVWLSDKYRRPIAGEYFSGSLHPRDAQGNPSETEAYELDLALDKSYRFAILDRGIKSVQLRLKYPGDSIRLDLEFDARGGRKSLKEWCGTE